MNWNASWKRRGDWGLGSLRVFRHHLSGCSPSSIAMNRRAFLKAVAVGVAIPGCRRPQPTAPSFTQADALLDLMRQRLAIMLDVARAKWNAKAPVEDAARERVVLAAVAEAGREFGLEPNFTTSFFAAQIEAAKIVQRAAFAQWEAEGRGPFADAPDLKRDLRPKIDDVGRKLLANLAEFHRGPKISPQDLKQRAEQHLVGDGITGEVRAVAIRPLEALQPQPIET